MDYEQQYFFIRKPKGRPELPSVSPKENTEDRTFRFEAQQFGSAPLFFSNGAAEYVKENGISPIKNLPPILFDGSDLLVDTKIREKLLPLGLPNIALHPAVYIDEKKVWHENYWYLTFTAFFDCWDRENSDYEQDAGPIKLGGSTLHQVYTYALDKDLLDKTPLQDRLLFKMGGVLSGYVVCHQSIRSVFASIGDSGAHFQAVGDY